MITITLPYLPPPEFSRNSREFWATLNRVRDRTSDDVKALLLEAGWQPSQPMSRAQIMVEFVLPNRKRRDHDNLITAMKPCWDALVQHQVIKDDCLSCIGIPTYRYRYSRHKEALTIIRIEEGA